MRFHTSLFEVLNSKTKIKIIKFLLNHEASMSEREIASILKVSHMSINRALREFADINLVDFITIGKAHMWKVNRKSYTYKILSRLIIGALSNKAVLEDLKKTLSRNLPETLVEKVMLFGSVANNTERTDSDIDLFIQVKDEQNKQRLEPSLDKLSNICFEMYGNRLAPYVLTEQEMEQKKELSIISGINKGIQILPQKKGQ